MAFARRQAIQHILLAARTLTSTAGCSISPGLNAAAAAAVVSSSDRYPTEFQPSRQWGWQKFVRHNSNSASVQQLLEDVSATQLRDALADEAELRPFMTYGELLDFIKAQKAAATEDEAEERAEVLAKAGVVLRFNGMVYLRPQEVAELVYKLLPSDPHKAAHNLEVVEQELAAMDQQHKQIQNHAQRWSRRWLVAGCTALALQLVGFTYLTWWELSWDVMEPVAYMLSLFYSLVAYCYFLWTRSCFEQKEFGDYWEQQVLEKRMAAAGFDLDKYQHLMRTRERYKRYMATKGVQLPSGARQGPEGDDDDHGPAAAAAAAKLKYG